MKRALLDTDLFVASKIRTLRLIAGMTQQQLGERSGISFQQVQKYEKAANRVTAGRLVQFAKAFNVPVSQFFREEPHEFKVEQRAAGTLVKHWLSLDEPHQLVISKLVEGLARSHAQPAERAAAE